MDRIGIQQEADLRLGSQLHNEPHIDSNEGISQVEVRQLVIDITIEDNKIGTGAKYLLHRKPCRKGVEKVEAQSNTCHERGLDVFVSTVDGRGRSSNTLVPLKHPVPRAFTDSGQPGNVLPERYHPDLQSFALKVCTECPDLSALSGAVNSRKTHRPGSAAFSTLPHLHTSRFLFQNLRRRTHCGRLGLPCESAATVPTATPAPTTKLSLMRIERTRRCFAGAITAPAGLEAATPVVFS